MFKTAVIQVDGTARTRTESPGFKSSATNPGSLAKASQVDCRSNTPMTGNGRHLCFGLLYNILSHDNANESKYATRSRIRRPT
jgi:hypothetical protein